MRVAVITPVFRETPEVLSRCLASVRNQTHPCHHVIVLDGGNDLTPDQTPGTEIIRLPAPHADWGNAARAIGAVSASVRGADAIAFLDADNWYSPHHIESLLILQASTNAAIVTSARLLYNPLGHLLGPCLETGPHTFIDTNCYLITRRAFGLLSVWYLLPQDQWFYGDRHLWHQIKLKSLPTTHSPTPTVHYTSRLPYP